MNRNIARTPKQYYSTILTALLFVVLVGMVAANSDDFDHTHKVVVPEVPAIYEKILNPPLMTLGIWMFWITLSATICVAAYWALVHGTD